MNENLRLPIKRQFLNEILSGDKTVEYRDFTQHYIDRIGFDPALYDEELHADGIPTHVKTVTLVNGRQKDAFTAVYEVLKICIEEFVDEDGNYMDDVDPVFAIYLGERIS